MMTNNRKKDQRFSLLLSAVEKGKTLPDQQFLGKLRDRSADEFQACSTQGGIQSQVSTVSFWMVVMKSRVTKIGAAAAIIVVAVILGVYQFGGRLEVASIAWADVVRPILNAKTVVYTIIVGEEGKSPPIRDMIMGSRIRRSVEGVEGVSIIDLETFRVLALDPKEHKAIYIDMKGLPEELPNPLEALRTVIVQLQESPHFAVEELGEQEIEGRRAIGFKAVFTGKQPNVEVVIWADPETALPIRIEQQEGQMRFICKDYQFDVDLDETLFSMKVPADYTEQQTELDLFGSTEEDFIEGLRVWAEYLGNGEFPEDVSVEYYVKQTPMLEEKFDKLDLSDEEELEVGMKLQRHILFIRFFKGEGQWHYAGKGVKLGDADKAIFWYRPKDSPTYRVIYGDLTVKDIAAENLPEP